jgi:2-deoxy-D-gluconate 3-dehydrogenase
MGKYDSFGLQGKVAIVTGGSEGIGRALALGLAEAGCSVVIAARTQSKLDVVAAEIAALGAPGLAISADMGQVGEIRRMVDETVAHFGRVDILVNNVAWTDTRPALEVDEDEWDRTLDVSLKSMFFASQAVAPGMIAQGGGKIINIGSNLAEVTFAGRVVYSTAKAGTHHLTRALANEWAAQGIHVNCVAPCITETPTRANLFARPGYREWVEEQMSPIGRWAQPEDMVGATLYLASNLSDMVVGHILMVDGGWTIR